MSQKEAEQKLSEAMIALAATPGTLQERLTFAGVALVGLRDDDLPHHLKGQHREINETLLKQGPFSDPTRLSAS